MGITPMFDIVTKLVEPLRREEQPDLQRLLSLYGSCWMRTDI